MKIERMDFMQSYEILDFARVGIIHKLSLIENDETEHVQKIRASYQSLLYKVDKKIIAYDDQFTRELSVEIATDSR